MDRRDFLKTVAITGAAMTIQRSEAMEILTQTINKANGDKPDLVAVMGGEPEPKRSPYPTIPATIGRSATKTAVSKRQQKKPEPKLCRPTWSLTTNPLTCQKDKR